MDSLKSSLSPATARAPFAPATELDHVPFVFYEIKFLATRGQNSEILPLIESVIAVTQQYAEGLTKLPHVAAEEVAYAL